MSAYTIEYLKSAYKHSIFHSDELLNSDECACFYCLSVFSPGQINEWTDEENELGKTALCPKCEIDAVLGSASSYPVTDRDFLKKMNEFFF